MNEMRETITRWSQFFSSQHLKHFSVALLLLSFATVLRIWPLQAIGEEITCLTFYPAVIAAMLYGSISAALMATFLTSLALIFLWPLFAAHPLINNLSSC